MLIHKKIIRAENKRKFFSFSQNSQKFLFIARLQKLNYRNMYKYAKADLKSHWNGGSDFQNL